jgi:sporulation protein YlmC with PRC-barrel domain
MKTTILFGAFLALTSLAIGQTQSTTTTTTSYLQTSTVIGSRIKDSRGQDVGVIKDFVLDRNTGCLAYVVLSTGTGSGDVVTTSTKTVAAPWAVFTASSDPRIYITRIEREKIYGAPVWESTRIPEHSRAEYINSVYGYYGIAAPRFDAQMSVGVTNTSTATTTASAAPTAAASVAPAATPASTVKPMPSPQGTPERSPLPQTTAPPSSAKAPASTRAPAKERSSPSTRAEMKSEKKTADEPAKKSEKASTKTESWREKTEPETEPSSKSTRPKKEPKEPSSEPESASTPKEPKEP